MANTYHVSKSGNDHNEGSAQEPFLTIQRAADIAAAGDTVVIHGGVYREWVKPAFGGSGDSRRITYEAAPGEHVVIKGSEKVDHWTRFEGTTWKTVVVNERFGDFNPFAAKLTGDWVVEPYDRTAHLGDVYLNGVSLYEAFSVEDVLRPQIREASPYPTWGGREEKLAHPEQSIYQWYAAVTDSETIIYANFHEIDPNSQLTEISVRRSCFYPVQTGRNYITVRGLELAQAANPWAPPTADQPGLIGPNWAKGWIIEDCDIHDAKCVGISLGKEASTGDNFYTRWNIKSGYHYQMEAVFASLAAGWSRERIGSHIVRRCRIHDCGQAGIVGHMGGAFSEIYDNEISYISTKHEFYGHELGGIKLHAAIDVQIRHNYIHNCSLGTWLDWEAQGVRVSSNVYDANNRDLMIEVSHGPCLVDNNIFTSPYSIENDAQGTAFVHNLICGFMHRASILDRATPYHAPHSTRVAGISLVYSGDDRWYHNILIGGHETDRVYGTADYDGAPTSLEEYIARVRRLGHGDVQLFAQIPQPAYIDGNVYLAGAGAYEREEHHLMSDAEPQARITRREDGVYLSITLPEGLDSVPTCTVATRMLGQTHMSDGFYETPAGEPIVIDRDLCGAPRGESPVPGPIEALHPGFNEVRVLAF